MDTIVYDSHEIPISVGDKVAYNKSGSLAVGTVSEIRIGKVTKGFSPTYPVQVFILEHDKEGNPLEHTSVVRNPAGILTLGCFPCNCLREKIRIGTVSDFLNG